MSEPTTFYPVAIDNEVVMKASPDGGYVLYEHYLALRRTIEQQAQEIERLTRITTQYYDDRKRLTEQLATAQARVRELEQQLEAWRDT